MRGVKRRGVGLRELDERASKSPGWRRVNGRGYRRAVTEVVWLTEGVRTFNTKNSHSHHEIVSKD